MEISSNKKFLYEEEKILYIIKDVLGAKSPETGVTMEQVIAKGIELGLTKDNQVDNWEGYKEGDHPWWPTVAPMMGVGPASKVMENEEPYLHRMKVKMDGKQRKSNVMVYWYDRSHRHEVVRKSNKATKNGKKVNVKPEEKVEVVTIRAFTSSEMESKVAQNPDKYMIIGNKLFSKEFVRNHPEKFDTMSVAIANA